MLLKTSISNSTLGNGIIRHPKTTRAATAQSLTSAKQQKGGLIPQNYHSNQIPEVKTLEIDTANSAGIDATY